MKQRKLNASEFEGYAVTVTIEGGIDKYAKAFLHIFNNVKATKELLYMENDYENNVTVYTEPECKDALIKYLENFGKINSCEKVLMYQIEDLPDYDLDKYYGLLVVPYSE